MAVQASTNEREIAIVTGDRQITLPPEIYRHLNLQPGSRVEFVVDTEGQVKLLPLTVSVATLAGILHRPNQPPVPIEAMEQAIRNHHLQKIHDWT